jgi:hypothetical protein
LTFNRNTNKEARGIGGSHRQCAQWRLEIALRKKAGRRLNSEVRICVH